MRLGIDSVRCGGSPPASRSSVMGWRPVNPWSGPFPFPGGWRQNRHRPKYEATAEEAQHQRSVGPRRTAVVVLDTTL